MAEEQITRLFTPLGCIDCRGKHEVIVLIPDGCIGLIPVFSSREACEEYNPGIEIEERNIIAPETPQE